MEAHDADNWNPDCPTCQHEMNWIECSRCDGEGFTEHDCFEDTCCCLNPDDDECRQCSGYGGWWQCSQVHEGRHAWIPSALPKTA